MSGTPVLSTFLRTPFYIAASQLYADTSSGVAPHAFVSFDNSGTSCGTFGPLVFTTSDTNKCSQQSGFVFDGTTLVFGTSGGSFEMCGTDNHVSPVGRFFFSEKVSAV